MADETPGFQFDFDAPPPFSYEAFKEKLLGPLLASFHEEARAYLGGLEGEEKEEFTRLMYFTAVTRIQAPDTSWPRMNYIVFYRRARHFLGRGVAPETIVAGISLVPWDALQGMGDYERETANTTAGRATADAIAGTPRPPLH
jgi:hypothetical protein